MTDYYTLKSRYSNPEITEQQETFSCAKTVTNSTTSYYILMDELSEYVDPFSGNFNSRNPRYRWQLVKESTFDIYIKFLQTKNQTFLNKCRRLINE